MLPRKPHFIGSRQVAPITLRAAQYIRMSTDHQKCSTENQKQIIAEYALCHDTEVVRTYIDAGRSGLLLKGRDALKRLISDVQEGRADFNIILVYDVSRWGRFQDADESAYYEFMCKAAGISVVYCTELFENNGSIISTLMKSIKRAMAGEYSRELSRKMSEAHSRLARLGFHQGGRPNYGLRRMLIGEDGRSKMILEDGQQKNLHNDHIILVPGPADEVRTVREIYRLFVTERMPHKRIARILNEKGILNGRGNQWSGCNIREILGNEKYIGCFVYNRTTLRLQSKRKYLSKDKWIRLEGAMRWL